MQVTVGTTSLHYEHWGAGPPLLLLHGGLVDSRSWERQRDLAKSFELLLPDTRGFGESTGPLADLTIADLAADLVGLLDAVGLEAAHLLGFSLGGMIAQALALRYPSRVRSLILVSTTARGAIDVPPRPPDPPGQAVEAHLARAFSPAFRDRETAFLARYRAMADENTGPGWDAVRRAMTGAPTVAEIGRLELPTLLVHARGDASIPLAAAEAVSRAIPGARLEVMEDSGHTMQIERPAAFNALVHDFVIEAERIASQQDHGRPRAPAPTRDG